MMTNIFDWILIGLRWVHLFFGVMWLGHLYYLNFSQQSLAASDRQRFRLSALWSLITGVLYLMTRGHQVKVAGLFSTSWGIFILIGATIGILMWFNAWFILGKAPKPNSPDQTELFARTSRTNLVLSFPMLFFMSSASHFPVNFSEAPQRMILAISILIILAAIEWNALKGKLGPLKSLVGAIHIGVVLALIMLGLTISCL